MTRREAAAKVKQLTAQQRALVVKHEKAKARCRKLKVRRDELASEIRRMQEEIALARRVQAYVQRCAKTPPPMEVTA